MFSGRLKCPECGGNINFHFNQGNHDIKFFSCRNHNSGLRKCSSTHYIRLDFLEQVVLYEVHRLACFANEYENDFIKAMVGRSAKVAENDRVRKKRELDGLLARDKELDMLFERLYEDNVSGKIDDARFAKMSKRYEQEQGENAGRIKALRLELKKLEDKRMDVDTFLETVRRYTDATTITKRMVAELIEYIEVYPAVKEDGVSSSDEKVIGKRLQEIAKNATTGGLYNPVGELYGFPIKVVSERMLKEGLEFTDNRFVVEGNYKYKYKYTYNNGHLAMADPVAAARNFLNALEKIPSTIDQYKAKNEALERDIPQLQKIAGKVWKKEDELKQLKSELAALDRKIQLELAPPVPEVAEKENDGQEVKPDTEGVRNVPSQPTEDAPQIRSPANDRSPSGIFIADHIVIGRAGFVCKPKGIKM